ncbi:MAG: DUF3536 domain-containing protein [Thermodesulfobacteriota bacterium]|nr:DUF3536 domain-containing protein [Thermodesulfobacteriota bacterium]
MERYICIHGHFYQPPRENPWLEEIEVQDSSYPYHDWNEKITAECYATNATSRILEPGGNIIAIVNNYSMMSFNFGPTLLSWMEHHRPDVYEAILQADVLSMKRFSGHGSALAQSYNHMIMPLANKRDKYTQTIWGIRDFQKRFKRDPEGMWLPETAVDIETLEVLAELGIRFTILAPRQAKRVMKDKKGARWQDVSGGRIDPTMPYLCNLPSGRTINLFFYDGPISQDIAFGGLLESGEAFSKRLIAAFSEERNWPQLVHIATDGETYGHHHRFGDMALAYCLYLIESKNLAVITNYGEYLEKHPPVYGVEIFENSSWSCVHGIERWRDNCGCHTGAYPKWNQSWRVPLRTAMDTLRDKITPLYEREASRYLKDPWEARNDYIDVILVRSKETIEKFLDKYTQKTLGQEEKIHTLKLLEMQRNAMLLYTSCGWFFDEISGIEATQVMRYAARVIQLAEELFNLSLERYFVSALRDAPSNVPELENGAIIYEMFVQPVMLDLIRVAAHFAISSLFEEYSETTHIYCYTVKRDSSEVIEAGKSRLTIGKTNIMSDITWDEQSISYAVLHLGDHNVNGGLRNYVDDHSFTIMSQEIKESFDKGDVPEIIRLMDSHFGVNNYSIWHLFRDEQRKVLKEILRSNLDEIEVSFRQVYENNYATMNFLSEVSYPFPKSLLVATEFVLNRDMASVFESENPDFELLERLINEVKRWKIEIDKPTLSYAASSMINDLTAKFDEDRENLFLIQELEHGLRLLRLLPLKLNLNFAQNVYFHIGNVLHNKMKKRAETCDEAAEKWLDAFGKLGYHLQVKVAE